MVIILLYSVFLFSVINPMIVNATYDNQLFFNLAEVGKYSEASPITQDRKFLESKDSTSNEYISLLGCIGVRNHKDENGVKLFDDPHYWAGFILLDALD